MSTRIRFAILGTLAVLTLAVTPFRPLKVTGSSMEPTFRDGETYVLDQVYWRPKGLRRGDIVVVRRDPEKWVKRLVGLPRDVLQLRYDGRGLLRGVANLTTHPHLRREGPDLMERPVLDDEIFVIGDNLNHSTDSTNQEVGAFKLKDVLGIVRTFSLRREFPFRRHL